MNVLYITIENKYMIWAAKEDSTLNNIIIMG